jgi:hypothetical protein
MPDFERNTLNRPERPRTLIGIVGNIIDAVIDGRLDWVKTLRLVFILAVVAVLLQLGAVGMGVSWLK